MQIKKAPAGAIGEIMSIYTNAQKFMAEHGNPEQWGNVYPPKPLIEEDIRQGKLYICEDGGKIVCVFYFAEQDDPTYRKIFDGEWQSSEPYSVIHRIAAAEGSRGAATFCLTWAFEQAGNIRIDTHEDNKPMRGLLVKLGYTYCGHIFIANGDSRIAFQKTK